MTEKQEYLLQMLDEIHEICMNNNIRYSLAGGSLIGAVRNKGFLPWDDDADIYMIRSEFERFEEACRTQLPENRILQTPLDVSYTNTFPRYTSTDTTAIHAHQVLNDEFVGEVIDIFILDPIHADEQTIRDYTYDLMLYSDLLNYSGVFGRRFGVAAEDFIKYRQLEEEKGSLYIRNLFEDKLASYLSDDGEMFIMRWGGNPMLRKRSWFDRVRETEFEGRMFLSGTGIDEYLVSHYGDEWYMVPRIKEQSSHDMAYSALITPDEAREICLVENRNEIRERLNRRKIGLLKNAEGDYELQRRKLTFEAEVVSADTMSRFEQWKKELSEEFSPSEIPVYEKIFGHYIEWQFSARIAGRDDWKGVHRYNDPIAGNLTPEAAHALLCYLFHSEKISRAARYIRILEYKGITDEYISLYDNAISQIRASRADLQYKRTDAACLKLKDAWLRFPCCKSVLKISIDALLRYEAQKGEEFPEGDAAEGFSVRSLIQTALRLYPEDGDYVYYKLKYDKLHNADIPQAELRERVSFIISGSRNGWILRDVAEMMKAAQEPDSAGQARTILAGGELADTRAVISDYEREISAVYENLQSEIAKLSSKAGLTLFMNPLQLKAIEDHEEFCIPEQNAYVLYMSGTDMLRLTEYLKDNPGALPDYIEYEYMGSNRTFPDLTIRFYDTRTTNLSLKKIRSYNHTGMYVSVQVFKPEKFRRKIRYQLDWWQKTCYTGESKKISKRLALLIHDMQKKQLFARVMKNCAQPRKRVRVELRGKQLIYKSSLFKKTGCLEKDGAQFAVPQKTGQYLAKVEKKLNSGELAFTKKYWVCSPRISLPEEKAGEYKALLHEQNLRKQRQRWERRIRRQLDAAFERQKAAIAAEEERRLAASGSTDEGSIETI